VKEFFTNSVYFGVVISLMSYEIGRLLQRRFKLAVFNPLLIAIILTMGTVCLMGVDYDGYYASAKYISYLLTPATVCLAVPLYEQTAMLKRHVRALAAGIVSGVLASLVCVLLLCKLFQMNHQQYVTLLPKSITTAIGMGVSQELGGAVTITVAVIIVTGILGNVMAEGLFKLLRIREPVAKGLALGTAAHAIGTAKAMEIGEVEGAMSSLAITVCGLLTAIVASFFAQLM
jgi:predicted murein hydrolase (TIGR00659 family)